MRGDAEAMAFGKRAAPIALLGDELDDAAQQLQVQNMNNKSSDERDKLRVFHVEGGRLLEFNEKI
ncbi:MAG: hypothetical protein E6614_31200, partial [Bradyrhizobium sp.]|nr:hypothetical protein [Bradyrhizobium sp.]